MPRISRYNRETKRLEWVDATPEEHEAWRAARAEKAAATRRAAPAGASAKGGKRSKRAPRPPAGAASGEYEGETLEDVTDDAVRQAAKSAGPAKPAAGPLSPIIGLLSRFGAVALIRMSARLTLGRHPMTPPEAVSITAPALRIADRELAKRVKWTPKGGPNVRDVEQIGSAFATYVLRGMFGSQAAGMPAEGAAPASFAVPPQADAPFTPEQTAPATAAPDAADDSDLFAGSEPVGREASAAGLSGGNTLAARQQNAGPPGAVSVPDSVWNEISPPERGLAEVMA